MNFNFEDQRVNSNIIRVSFQYNIDQIGKRMEDQTNNIKRCHEEEILKGQLVKKQRQELVRKRQKADEKKMLKQLRRKNVELKNVDEEMVFVSRHNMQPIKVNSTEEEK